jgi:hypothetical protein
MNRGNNLTPKVTVVVSTPDVGQAPMPEAASARVKMFNSTAETAEILRIGRDRHDVARFGNSR